MAKHRVVLELVTGNRNELRWLATKDRKTMKDWVSERITNAFLEEIPKDFSMLRAVELVSSPDFDPFDIPFD